jgi:hypothetical protein
MNFTHSNFKRGQKSVLRPALRPNQISFSHSLGPLLPAPDAAACPHMAHPGSGSVHCSKLAFGRAGPLMMPHRVPGPRERREEGLIQRAASDGIELMRCVAQQVAVA